MLSQHGLQYDELPSTLTNYTSGDLVSGSGASSNNTAMQLPRFNMNFSVNRGASGSGNSG